ncbi:biopolymer transporter ExbD [bacterium]|nr:biopolymer transporter ExbD [bacterium]MBU1064194.1 biopolymer transporter ExbD [bacterium]MBU1633735.1 biopolymer transporter ExbD [bacterium]MBU1874355.1 biopolymer transporter ExbD [bacterium]
MKRTNYTSISEINVTNLVDVTMVLLIIFMITAPLMRTGLQVELPESKINDLKNKEGVTVTITRDGNILIENETVNLQQMGNYLTRRLSTEGNLFVLLHADKSVPYGKVISVMDYIKQAGFSNIGLVLTPGKDT